MPKVSPNKMGNEQSCIQSPPRKTYRNLQTSSPGPPRRSPRSNPYYGTPPKTKAPRALSRSTISPNYMAEDSSPDSFHSTAYSTSTEFRDLEFISFVPLPGISTVDEKIGTMRGIQAPKDQTLLPCILFAFFYADKKFDKYFLQSENHQNSTSLQKIRSIIEHRIIHTMRTYPYCSSHTEWKFLEALYSKDLTTMNKDPEYAFNFLFKEVLGVKEFLEFSDSEAFLHQLYFPKSFGSDATDIKIEDLSLRTNIAPAIRSPFMILEVKRQRYEKSFVFPMELNFRISDDEESQGKLELYGIICIPPDDLHESWTAFVRNKNDDGLISWMFYNPQSPGVGDLDSCNYNIPKVEMLPHFEKYVQYFRNSPTATTKSSILNEDRNTGQKLTTLFKYGHLFIYYDRNDPRLQSYPVPESEIILADKRSGQTITPSTTNSNTIVAESKIHESSQFTKSRQVETSPPEQTLSNLQETPKVQKSLKRSLSPQQMPSQKFTSEILPKLSTKSFDESSPRNLSNRSPSPQQSIPQKSSSERLSKSLTKSPPQNSPNRSLSPQQNITQKSPSEMLPKSSMKSFDQSPRRNSSNRSLSPQQNTPQKSSSERLSKFSTKLIDESRPQKSPNRSLSSQQMSPQKSPSDPLPKLSTKSFDKSPLQPPLSTTTTLKRSLSPETISSQKSSSDRLSTKSFDQSPRRNSPNRSLSPQPHIPQKSSSERLSKLPTKSFDESTHQPPLAKTKTKIDVHSPTNFKQLFTTQYKDGKGFGLDGQNNSCYMDSVLFSMFYASKIFDEWVFLQKMSTNPGCPDGKRIRNILQFEIIDNLRGKHFVPYESTLKLREVLGELNSKVLGNMMDVDELISTLLGRALNLKKFIHYSVGTSNYLHQLMIDVKEFQGTVTDVQTLLGASMAIQGLKLMDTPCPAFIIKIPRSNGKLVGCDEIVPNLTLDIGGIVAEGSNSKAHYTKMELCAVIVLKNYHYTTFVRMGLTISSPWLYFDSMPARTKLIPHLGEELQSACDVLADKASPTSREWSRHFQRLIANIHLCIYYSPERVLRMKKHFRK